MSIFMIKGENKMDFLKGLQNFLIFINDNWTAILVCIGLIIGLIQKIKTYVNLE